MGYVIIKLGCEPAPLLLGFILGPMMEENFRRALLISRGNYTTFIESPVSITLLAVAAVLALAVALPAIKRAREVAFQEE
jgi:TctA family transporter